MVVEGQYVFLPRIQGLLQWGVSGDEEPHKALLSILSINTLLNIKLILIEKDRSTNCWDSMPTPIHLS